MLFNFFALSLSTDEISPARDAPANKIRDKGPLKQSGLYPGSVSVVLKRYLFRLIKTSERIAFVVEGVENRQKFRDRQKVLNLLRQI